jgi:hypothetical protein
MQIKVQKNPRPPRRRESRRIKNRKRVVSQMRLAREVRVRNNKATMIKIAKKDNCPM